MDCKIEINVSDRSPIGIAHGLIENELRTCIVNGTNINGLIDVNEYDKALSIALINLEEIANHILVQVESARKRFSVNEQ